MKHLAFFICLLFGLGTTTLVAQEEEYGLASYYSDDFQGRSTAYGETYDKDQLTCAHKRYPYGTMLRVTRLDTKKSVNVKVTDKGPFIKGRVVDLSRRAAEILGMLNEGAVEVKVERINRSSTRTADVAPAPAATTRAASEEPAPTEKPAPVVQAEATRPAAPEPVAKPAPTTTRPAAAEVRPATVEPVKPAATRPAATAERQETREEVVTKPERNALVGDDYNPYGLYKIVLEKPGDNANYGVQVASFTSYENVMQKVADLQAKWFDNILISIEPGTGGVNTYKVILGPFGDQKTAQHYQESLRSRYKINGFVLDLGSLKY